MSPEPYTSIFAAKTMPTFSTIQLENLLQQRAPNSFKESVKLDQTTSTPKKIQAEAADVRPPVATKHIYISPALYTTPEPAPIPEELSVPLSPSPYVVNHKRRGGWSGTVGNRRSDGAEIVPAVEMEERVEGDSSDMVNDDSEGDRLRGQGLDDLVAEDEEEGFLDSKCESMSVGSANGSIRQFDCRSFMSAQGEYFDAVEDFSSDNSGHTTSLYTQGVESELRAISLSRLEEIDRRNNAEEAFDLMLSRWQKMSNLLHEAKLTYPSSSSARGTMYCEDVSMEEVAQEVIVCKFVSEAIAKGLGRAEAGLEAEVIMGTKDQEISRLRDKMTYYEAVNREMSQRNQEIIEHARKKRLRRKSQKRWFWSCIGLSIVAGISVVAYSYLPEVGKHEEFPEDLPGDASSSSEAS